MIYHNSMIKMKNSMSLEKIKLYPAKFFAMFLKFSSYSIAIILLIALVLVLIIFVQIIILDLDYRLHEAGKTIRQDRSFLFNNDSDK
jgi:hypothetical protein